MKKIKLHPLFLIYVIFLLLFGQFESVFTYFIVVLLHEFSHSITAKKLGYKLDKTILMPYGVCLNYKTNNFFDDDEIKIEISGPLVNFLLSIICLALWWLFPALVSFMQVFFLCNVVMFSFNLLPCYPLDGGRILCAILSKKYDRKWATKLCLFFNIVISFIFILAFFIGLFFGVFNINLIIISIFLICGIIEPKNYCSYNYLSCKIIDKTPINKEKQIKFTLISCNMKIYKILAKLNKNKFNVFYVILPNGQIKIISEIMIKKLALKYNSTISLSEIPEIYFWLNLYFLHKIFLWNKH